MISEFILLIGMSVVSILINIRVFFIVMYNRKKRQRDVRILVSHLAVLTIASNLQEALFFADKAELIILRAPFVCSIMSFVRKILHGAIPLNIFAIIYERVRTYRVTNNWEKFLVIRTLLLIWILGVGGSIPSLALYRYEPGEGRYGICKKMHGRVFSMAYELVRLVLYNATTSGCIAWALYTIRSKMKYLQFLQRNPTEKARLMVYRLRFIYIYAILFIVIWLLVAVTVFLFKLFSPTVMSTSLGKIAWIPKILSLLYYTYSTLNPVIYLVLNENMSIGYILGCEALKTFFDKSVARNSLPENCAKTNPTEEDCENPCLEELIDVSRFPTVAVSEDTSTPMKIVETRVKVDLANNPGTFV